jgi:hypothetical protein
MTVQYGTGSQFAAQCPAPLAAPPGFRYWNVAIDGPIPPDILSYCTTAAANMSLPLGYQTSLAVAGKSAIIAQIEPHPWTHNAQGQVVQGCYHACGLYISTSSPVVPPAAATGGNSVGGILFAVAMGMGAVVSAISIWDYIRRHNA